MKYENDVRFEGQWKLDKREGFGVLNFPGQTFYEGDFASDSSSGEGVLYQSDALPTLYEKNEDLHGRSKYFRGTPRRYKKFLRVKLRVNDVVWITKPKEFLKDVFPKEWERLQDGHWSYGKLNGAAFCLYGCAAVYEGCYKDG
jgi:hypothetical protein